ncbi:MAG TPA: prolyl oligopeptidase family serine peptidase [Solirubrobacterales bacterium]|jgi:acetyl esterase/lipase
MSIRPRLAWIAAAALAAALAWAPAAPAAEILTKVPYYLALHPAKGEARGTVLLLHGGGWQGDLGRAVDRMQAPTIKLLRGWGFDVATLGYRSGEESLEDAVDAFDELRGRFPERPICVFGFSAGAQLGLIAAARRGEAVACVVDLLGPPDLEEMGNRRRSRRGEDLARMAFGGAVRRLSPIRNAKEITAPVLIGAAECDAYVAPADHERFAKRLREAGGDATLVLIEPGRDVDLEHCKVDGDSYDEFMDQAREFMTEAAARWTPPPAAAEPAAEEEGGGAGLWIGLAGVLAGVALAVWAWRR